MTYSNLSKIRPKLRTTGRVSGNFGKSKVPAAGNIADTNESEDVDKAYDTSATETPKAEQK